MGRDKKTYLKENRLADVIALIQVLAFDKFYQQTVFGLNSELQGIPKSASSWDELAREHPEFFRVIITKDQNEETETSKISLISRRVQLNNYGSQADSLSPDLAKKFFETAIQLHDIQKEKSKKNQTWMPLIVAFISVLFSTLGTLYVQYKNNETQTYLKHYEVEQRPRQEGYYTFMRNLGRAYYMAHIYNHKDYLKAIEEGEGAFFILEPFLSTVDRHQFWNEYQKFQKRCSDMIMKDSTKINNDQVFKSFDSTKNYFQHNLYSALFDTNTHPKAN